MAALAEGTLTLKKAIEIANYHLRRNEIARLSCRKRKLAKFKKAGFGSVSA